MLGLQRPDDPLAMDCFLEAADLYVASKRGGISVRPPIDCLIASIAIGDKTPVWHLDCDFAHFAAFTQLETWSPPHGLLT